MTLSYSRQVHKSQREKRFFILFNFIFRKTRRNGMVIDGNQSTSIRQNQKDRNLLRNYGIIMNKWGTIPHGRFTENGDLNPYWTALASLIKTSEPVYRSLAERNAGNVKIKILWQLLEVDSCRPLELRGITYSRRLFYALNRLKTLKLIRSTTTNERTKYRLTKHGERIAESLRRLLMIT
jgi:predicted transcriptional regulator